MDAILTLFERFDLSYLLIGLGVVAVAVAHYFLARLAVWSAFIVPTLYLGFVGWLFATGRITGIVDAGLLLLGLVALISYGVKARESVAAGRA